MVDWRELSWHPLNGGSASVPFVEDNSISVPSLAGVEPPSPQISTWAGDKYYGGFGATQLYQMDYWTLRERSAQVFRDNLYARGLIRRLVTNEINTGLELEALPEESVIGVPEDSLAEWTEEVESRFSVWAEAPTVCDYEKRRVFAELQRIIRREALICGDVLLVLHISKVTGLPQLQIINASHVESPMDDTGIKANHTIDYGVERDASKRHVAYWVTKDDGTSVRVPCYGARSKRRVAWMVYGTDMRVDDVRGEPLLSIILQSIKEIDRYRDAATRKATINSILAMFIKKSEDKMGTLPFQGGGAVRHQTVTPISDEPDRKFTLSDHLPGVVIEELQVGEEPVPHSTAGTDVNFGPFEEAIVHAIAWANEIPPEILRLAFTKNYAGSQSAINEFKMYLNLIRSKQGAEVNQPIYTEWLISQVLLGNIRADGFLEAWRDPRRVEEFYAWVRGDWSGAIKPSADIVKQATGYQLLNKEGWITNGRAARELTGTKFTKNIKTITRENQLKLEAMRPLLELEERVGPERAAELWHGKLFNGALQAVTDTDIDEETT